MNNNHSLLESEIIKLQGQNKQIQEKLQKQNNQHQSDMHDIKLMLQALLANSNIIVSDENIPPAGEADVSHDSVGDYN